jgi:acetylornithine deacetylase
MEVVELLRTLVRAHSPSGSEDAAVAVVADAMSSLGMAPEARGRNVVAFLGEGDKTLLLNSHTDTVPLGEGWTKDPLGAELIDGKIYGRGSNDAKASVASMIIGASRAFSANAPKGRVCLGLTCEEEINGKGLETLIQEVPRPSAAVVGEPTGLNPAVAQKGLLILEITAKGRSAHAAHGGGVNAVELAARDILALSNFRFDRAHPALGKPTLAVTQVQGGTRHNVIPDRCKLVVDIRTTPDYEPEQIASQVATMVKGEVSVRSKRLQSVDTDLDEKIVKAALAANPAGKPYGSPTLSDWVFLKGIPTVKCGPGDSKRSHTPDEFVTVEELEAGAAFYEKLIREYFA